MAVKLEFEKFLSRTEAITDAHILDHTLANLTKLSASLQGHILKESIEAMPLPNSFATVEKFRSVAFLKDYQLSRRIFKKCDIQQLTTTNMQIT